MQSALSVMESGVGAGTHIHTHKELQLSDKGYAMHDGVSWYHQFELGKFQPLSINAGRNKMDGPNLVFL